MTVDKTVLGRCPHCDQPVPADELVIDYRSARGKRVTTARCPECITIVTVSQ